MPESQYVREVNRRFWERVEMQVGTRRVIAFLILAPLLVNALLYYAAYQAWGLETANQNLQAYFVGSLLLELLGVLFFGLSLRYYDIPKEIFDDLEPNRELLITTSGASAKTFHNILVFAMNDSQSIIEAYMVLANEVTGVHEAVSHNARLDIKEVRQGSIRDGMAVLPPKGMLMCVAGEARPDIDGLTIPLNKPQKLNLQIGDYGILDVAIFHRVEGEREFRRKDMDVCVIWLREDLMLVYKVDEIKGKSADQLKELIKEHEQKTAEEDRSDKQPEG